MPVTATEPTVKPAADIWTDPMPESFEDQVAFFKREGFLILRGVLDHDALSRLDGEIARLARDHDKTPSIREGFSLEDNQDETRSAPTFRKIGGITDLSAEFGKLREHPSILEPLHAIMGDTIEIYRDVCMMKPARVGREKPWHQDSVYWPWEPMSLVSAMTALDPATPENGCLQIIPGSHHDVLQHYGQELQVDVEDDLLQRTRYVPLNPGDTLLFHSLLLHGSEPNYSDDDRRVCIVSYKTPYVWYIGKGEQRETPVVSQRS